MKVDKTSENLAHCICLYCPSYSPVCKLKNAQKNINRSDTDFKNTEHYEKMFCAFEKSNCIHLDRGCLCEKCQIYRKYGLNHHDYCLKTGGM
ncbi:MAG: DUF2769 domain-containing protein [Alphaproteobacteria bacterium]|nr:DUF2769 domain-containing protein [Alphaproteobacteria bacterium]